jgi:hypothetical protein
VTLQRLMINKSRVTSHVKRVHVTCHKGTGHKYTQVTEDEESALIGRHKETTLLPQVPRLLHGSELGQE